MTYNRRQLLLVAATSGALILGACGGSGNNDRDRDPANSTNQVLAIASTPDDTGAPISINNGAFVFNDTREDTDPVSINNSP